MAFWWKNLSVTELLILHGKVFAFLRRFLSIPPKPDRKVFQALPKQPEPSCSAHSFSSRHGGSPNPEHLQGPFTNPGCAAGQL